MMGISDTAKLMNDVNLGRHPSSDSERINVTISSRAIAVIRTDGAVYNIRQC